MDLMAQMGRNLHAALQHNPRNRGLGPVDFIEDMVKRGLVGREEKPGGLSAGEDEKGRQILTLDYKTMEYRPQQKPQFASLEAVSEISNRRETVPHAVRRCRQGGRLRLETSQLGALLRRRPPHRNRR